MRIINLLFHLFGQNRLRSLNPRVLMVIRQPPKVAGRPSGRLSHQPLPGDGRMCGILMANDESAGSARAGPKAVEALKLLLKNNLDQRVSRQLDQCTFLILSFTLVLRSHSWSAMNSRRYLSLLKAQSLSFMCLSNQFFRR